MIRRLLLALVALAPANVWAASTIDPTKPANNTGLTSSVLRQNFLAAYTDINNILSGYSGTIAPTSPSIFQRWINTTANPFPINIYDGAQWVSTGSINTSTHAYALPSPLTGGSLNLSGSAAFGSPLFQSLVSEAQTAGTSYVIGNVLQHTRTGGTGHRETLGVILQGTASGLEFMAAGQATAHATGTGAAGQWFGWNPYCWIDAAVSVNAQCVAQESDVDIRNASVLSKVAHQAIDVSTSTGFGSVIDAGYVVGKQAGGRGFGNAFQVGLQGATDGIANGGTILLHLGGNITNGINLSLSTITGFAWQSPGATIDGVGNEIVASLKTSTVALGGCTIGSNRLCITNTTAGSGNLGETLNIVQTVPHASDTGDSALNLNYQLTAVSATNQLVGRVFSYSVRNTLTGGGSIGELRGLNLVTNTDTGTSTTNLASLYLENGVINGTVTNGYGIYISALQGTTKHGIYDVSGAPSFFQGGVKVQSGTVITSTAAFTNNSGAQAATITNGPVAGNPTKWMVINDNGTTRSFPTW